jgi:hypothetical protein
MDRYINETVADVPHAGGAHVRIVLRKPRRYPDQRFVTYTATAADAMWTLADRFFSNSQDWWVLADMNPHVMCPDDLTYGTTMLIPVG